MIWRLTFLILFLLAPSYCLAQDSTAARRSWQPFFKQFRRAVERRDRETLRGMLSPDFHYSSGHHRRQLNDAVFEYWDEQNGRGWKAFKKILALGTVPMARWWNNGNQPGRPSRVTPPAANRRINIKSDQISWYAVFEFRSDHRWYCVIFKECCD